MEPWVLQAFFLPESVVILLDRRAAVFFYCRAEPTGAAQSGSAPDTPVLRCVGRAT